MGSLCGKRSVDLGEEAQDLLRIGWRRSDGRCIAHGDSGKGLGSAPSMSEAGEERTQLGVMTYLSIVVAID